MVVWPRTLGMRRLWNHRESTLFKSWPSSLCLFKWSRNYFDKIKNLFREIPCWKKWEYPFLPKSFQLIMVTLNDFFHSRKEWPPTRLLIFFQITWTQSKFSVQDSFRHFVLLICKQDQRNVLSNWSSFRLNVYAGWRPLRFILFTLVRENEWMRFVNSTNWESIVQLV